MQKIGQIADEGFTKDDLIQAQKVFKENGCIDSTLFDLNPNLPEKMRDESDPASFLVVRNGISILLNKKKLSVDHLEFEQKSLTPDTKFYNSRTKKVLNKHARYNLCFAEKDQVANYEQG